MSYSYVRPFVGIPLNQLHNTAVDDECNELLDELQAHCYGELEAPSYHAQHVLDWFAANQKQLKAIGVDFCSDYHGGDEMPRILGVYLDDLFNIPDYGAGKMRLDGLGKVYEMLEEFREIYAKLDQSVRDVFDRNDLVGMWFNSHSS